MPLTNDDFDAGMQIQATANSAAGHNVQPQAAVDAIHAAPSVGVDPSTAMHDPAPWKAQAQASTDAAVVASSPSVRSFVATSPAHAAAVKDDFAPLAHIAATANKWNDIATHDFFAPGESAVKSLMVDVPRWFNDSGTGSSLLDLIPGFSAKDRKLGSVLADVAGVAFSPFSGAVNMAARPFSYIPMPIVGPDGKLSRATQPQAQANVANIIGTALMGLGPEARIGRAGPINEGTFGQLRRLPGPSEPIPDAEFADIHPPGVSPPQNILYSSVADLDAEHAGRLQEALTSSATTSRSPVLMQDYLENHTALGGQNVSVPPESIAKLWADGHEVFADHIDAVKAALASGSDVQVPYSTYLTETAGKSFAEDLNSVTRFREGGVSQEEAKGLGTTEEEAETPKARTFVPPADIGASPEVKTIAANADAAVEQVFKEQALNRLFTDGKALGLTEAQLSKYSSAVEDAQAALHDKLLQRSYDQIRRERTPEWKAAIQLHTEAAINSINGQKNVKAYIALRDPTFKLDTEQTASAHPDLPLPSTHTKHGGLAPDEAASLAGYDSGAELVAELHGLQEAVKASGGNLAAYIKQRAKVYAEEQSRTLLGYDISPEGMVQAAREAMIAPEVEDLLTKDLRAFADAKGLPFDKTAVKELAQAQFNSLTVAEAIKPKDFAENMRRLGNKAEAALLDGKDIQAFAYKQKQLLQYLQMREAFAFAKEFAKVDRAMRIVGKKPTVPSMDQTARNHLRGIVQELGYPVRSGKFESVESALKGQSLEAYRKGLTTRGLPVYITDVPRVGEGTDIPSVKALDVATFRDLDTMMKSIAQLGRDEKTAVVGGKKVELDALAQEVKANATAIGRPFTAGEAQLTKGKVKVLDLYKPSEIQLLMKKISSQISSGQRNLGAATTRSEVPLFWLDRETNGPLMKSIVNPLNEGSYYKSEKIKTLSDAFKGFLKEQPKGWAKTLDSRVSIPELTYGRDAEGQPVPWLNDRGNVIRAALHMGTEDNWANLIEGFGWDPAVTKAAIERTLSPADWKYVQFLWDQAHELWPETQALYRDTVGLAPKEIVGRNFTPVGGPAMRGRYWHLDYDWNAVGEHTTDEGQTIDVQDPMSLGESDLFGNSYRVATPPNGSTKQRTQFRGPLNLDHSTLHREFESVIHDLAFRRPLIQAVKVLKHPTVRNAIRESLGPEYYTRTQEWLQQIARQSVYDQTALKGLAGMLRGIRRRFTIFQIGYNVTTLVKHGGIAAVHMTGEGGTHLAGAVGDLLRDGAYWSDFIDANSGEVRNTLANLDRDVREVMERSFRDKGFVGGYAYHATTMFGIVKRVEAQATWLAKYREVYEGGSTHEDAAALANKAVRDTQGSGSVVNLNALQSGDGSLGSEALKLFNLFTTFENTLTNRMWTVLRRQGRVNEQVKLSLGKANGRGFGGFEDEGWAGARRDSLRNLTQLLAFLVIPPLFVTALDEVTGKHGRKFLARLLEHSIQGTLGGTIPFGNSLAGAVEAAETHGRETGGDDAITSMMKSYASTGANVADKLKGEPVADTRWVQHAIETAGYTTGMPLKPAARAGQFAYDKSNGRVPSGVTATILGTLFGSAAVKEDASSTAHGSHHK